MKELITEFDSRLIIQVLSIIYKALCLGLRVMSFSESANVPHAKSKHLQRYQKLMTLIKDILLSQKRKHFFNK